MQEPKLEQIQAIEHHHPDRQRQPNLTIKMSRKEHQQLHGVRIVDNPLSRKIREYDALCRQIVAANNWQIAFEKDFETKIDVGLVGLRKRKRHLAWIINKLIRLEKEKVGIKGIGTITLASILGLAHPSRFSSLRKFLFYCGYTQASTKLKRYNRRIKPVMHEATRSVIMQKDVTFYPLYQHIKIDLATRNPTKPKIAIDQMARNRVSTLILKKIYLDFRADNREVF